MAFDQSATAGDTLVAGSIHSPNFATGSSGWTINRDGSAEFQNVLVRGTITGSTIIGSTIIGGTVIGGIFKSANFDNTAHTGFEINATSSPDTTATPPVPANTIQIYSAFQIGPTGGQNIQIGFAGGTSFIDFFSGLAGETASAGFGTTSITQGAIVTPQVVIQSATMANGSTLIGLVPSTGTGAGDFEGHITMGTLATTIATGHLVAGVMDIGNVNLNTSDSWTVRINNENSVIVAGPSVGKPALILGNIVTPQSRLLISVSEFLSIDGAGNTETIYLNSNNAETVAGGVASVLMRPAGATDGNTYTINSTTYSNPTTNSLTLKCPPSGQILVHLSAVVIDLGGAGSNQFGVGSINIANTTQGTTPFGPSDGRGWQYKMSVAAGVSYTMSGHVLASGLGNPGDTLVITPRFRTTVAVDTFQIQKATITAIPSF